jgi:hypothetical protein
MIEPIKQEYAQSMLVVRDRNGRALEVVIKEKPEWRPIESAPFEFRRLFGQVQAHHFKTSDAVQ